MDSQDDGTGGGSAPETALERFRDTVPRSYFDRIYAESADPWQFESSDYEQGKYRATLDALPRERYQRAFEVGCSIGVLTRALAPRCQSLLAVDVAEQALEQARLRCRDQVHVELRLMQVPESLPDGRFDLILLSEVGYYWSATDLERFLGFATDRLVPGGTLELVHWVISKHDYPLTGDAVHDLASARPQFRLCSDHRPVPYRLTVLERV